MNRPRPLIARHFLAASGLACFALIVLAAVSPAGQPAEEPNSVVFPRRPAPSPDGRSIAFCYQGDIWVIASEGGTARRLTVHPAYETDPCWSPDGTWIAFSSDRDGNADLYILPVEGGPVRRLTWSSTWDTPCSWTNDGSGILFNSARHVRDEGAAGLYLVPANGGTPVAVFATGANDGEISPDGTRLAYYRHGDSWWRRGYEGNGRGQLWIYTSPPERPVGATLSRWAATGATPETAAGDGKKVEEAASVPCTNAGLLATAALQRGGTHNRPVVPLSPEEPLYDNGAVRDPHWLPDGRHLLYLGETDGVANVSILDVDLSIRRQLTAFTDGRLRAVNLAQNGSLCAFEYEDGIWTVAVPPPPSDGSDWPRPVPQPRRLDIRLPQDEPRAVIDRLKVTGGADELAISPDGEQIAFVYRGDVFVMKASKEEPFANNVTRHPARDYQVCWAPDSKSLLFVSDRSGNRDLYRIRSADPREPRLSRTLAFEVQPLATSPEEESRPLFDPAGKRIAFTRGVGQLVTTSAEGKEERLIADGWSDLEYRWSPDGRWLTYARNDDEYNLDVWVVPAEGGPARNISQHPSDDYSPRWSADGRLLAFVSQRRYLNQTDLWYVRLTRADEELSPLDRIDRLASSKDGDKAKDGPADSARVQIDFERIDERTRRLTSFPGSESDVLISKDGSTFFFVSDTDGKKDLWKVKWDGTEPKRLTSGGVEPSFVQFDSKGTKIFFLKAGGGIASIGLDGGEMTSYPYEGMLTVDRRAERGFVFDEAWRMMRDRFYDPGMHGTDWPALWEKFRPWALAASTPRDFQDVVKMMLGELNSSHQNIWGGLETNPNGAATGELGVVFAPERVGEGDGKAEGLRIAAVVPRTPAERGESRLAPGETIVAIDGRPVAASSDLAELLDRTVDRKTRLAVRAENGTEREVVIRPSPLPAFRTALARQETDARRQYVDERSGGRLAYLAIESMDTEDFEEYERQLYAVAHGKDALLIDVRGNGGGWITDLLLASLLAPDHAETAGRGGTRAYPQDRRLLYTWTKPIVLLIDEHSFSNAEIFAWAIKTLRRGPIVGTRTFGGVISTGATTLLDGSTLRLPGRGWYTRYDGSPEEGTGCPPDVEVRNTPEDLERGRDRQLEAAVAEGMKLLR